MPIVHGGGSGVKSTGDPKKGWKSIRVDEPEEKFHLVSEITNTKECIDDVPKNEYYKSSRSDERISIYSCPRYIITELKDVLFIKKDQSYPINNAILAASLYGLDNLIQSEGYQSLSIQHERFRILSQEHEITDQFRRWASECLILKLGSNDIGSGFVRYQFRCPEHIHDKLLTPLKVLSVPFHLLLIRFIADALRIQPITHDFERKEMNRLLDEELNPQVQFMAEKLEMVLNRFNK